MEDVHIVHDEYGGEMELFSLHEPEWTQRGTGHPGLQLQTGTKCGRRLDAPQRALLLYQLALCMKRSVLLVCCTAQGTGQ